MVSVQNSPIYDLGYLFYVCATTEDLKHRRELLTCYNNKLARFMKQLGSNPETIFPYELFQLHWRRYRFLGFTIFPMLMKFLCCSDDEIKSQEAENMGDSES